MVRTFEGNRIIKASELEKLREYIIQRKASALVKFQDDGELVWQYQVGEEEVEMKLEWESFMLNNRNVARVGMTRNGISVSEFLEVIIKESKALVPSE